jgi:fatty acid desaturase
MLGRRGAILISYGTVWSLYGFAQITSPQPDQRGLKPLLEVAPLAVWGGLWVATGLVAVVAAWLPQGLDWAGFLALPAMVLPWMGSYAAAWVTGDFPRGWVAALVWGVIAVPVLVVAGWREPPRIKRVSMQ